MVCVMCERFVRISSDYQRIFLYSSDDCYFAVLWNKDKCHYRVYNIFDIGIFVSYCRYEGRSDFIIKATYKYRSKENKKCLRQVERVILNCSESLV